MTYVTGFEPGALVTSPEDIFALIQQLSESRQVQPLDDRRIHKRQFIFLPVQVTFLDSDGEPLGKPIDAITRDLSMAGLGILSTSAEIGDTAVIRFEESGENVRVDVVYCQPCGPFFQIGTHFSVDWDAPSSHASEDIDWASA